MVCKILRDKELTDCHTLLCLVFCFNYQNIEYLLYLSLVTRINGDVGHFATKTSYLANANMDTSYPLPDECKPVFFWGMLRHGTRNPSDEDIIILADRLPEIKDRLLESWSKGNSFLSEDLILYLDMWEFNLKPVDDGAHLTEAGWDEHFGMGERWGARLNNFVDAVNTEVRTSSKSRCRHSSEAFTTGLFGEEAEFYIDDNLARFYDDCPKYLEDIEANTATYKEVSKFDASEAFTQIIIDVTERTGVTFGKKDLLAIWEICRLESAWSKSLTSPWCEVFSSENTKALEFREDLSYYYSEGYGYNLTMEMTQPVWQDLISRLEDVQLSDSKDHNSTVLLFTHSTATLPFMASLGLYNSANSPTAADWPTENYKWKTSQIASFATNLVFVVGECESVFNKNLLYKHESDPHVEQESVIIHQIKSDSSITKFNSELKIFLFHQEHPVPIPGLIHKLDDFINQYKYKTYIDFNKTCGL